MAISQKLNLEHAFIEATVVLMDGEPVSLDASFGNTFYLNAFGDRTTSPPLNPTDGQKIVLRHFTNGADRTLTLSTDPGGFRFGSSI